VSGYFYHDRVLVLRPGTKTNRAQETVLDYAGLELAAGYPRDKVQLRPIAQSELNEEDRNAGTEVWALATEPGSGDWDVRDTDWLRLPDGRIAAVSGPPARPSDPVSGLLHHVEIRARRVAG
jgi:hypothetical protein